VDSNRSPKELLEFATQYHEDSRQEAELPTFKVAIQTEYPLDALGEILGGAAKSIFKNVQAAPEIAAHSVLSIAAFATQDKASVQFDGRVYPLSLFLLTVAESGERKSACDKVASAPIATWQKAARQAYADELARYFDESELYKSEHRTLISKKGTSLDEKRESVTSLNRPELPIEPIAICQEPSLEGLQKSFMNGRPSQALFNDEGGQFFGGHAMNKDNALKTMSGLSKYWDGAPIIRTRATPGESAELYDRRLTVHLQVQPIVSQKVLNDPLMLGQGLLARFLLAEAPSQAGSRLYNGKNALDDPSVIRFHLVIEKLLAHEPETLPGGGLDLPHLQLSHAAQSAWVAAYNQVELALAEGEMLETVKGVASKAGENAVRLAGVFAIIENSSEISVEQVHRAWLLMFYYLNVSLRSTQLQEASKGDRFAVELNDWLRKQPAQEATIADIQKKGPRKTGIRKSVKYGRALMQDLVNRGWAVEISRNTYEMPSAWRCIA